MARNTGPEPFRLYNVKVRIGGDMLNESRINDCTAPEAMLLVSLHGPDSLVECVDTGVDLVISDDPKLAKWQTENNQKWGDAQERRRLIAKYESVGPHRAGLIQRLFGPQTMRLPRQMDPEFNVTAAVSAQQLPKDHPGDPVAAAMT